MTVLLPSYVSIDTQFDIEFIQVRFVFLFSLVFYSSITAVEFSRTRNRTLTLFDTISSRQSVYTNLRVRKRHYLVVIIAVISSSKYVGSTNSATATNAPAFEIIFWESGERRAFWVLRRCSASALGRIYPEMSRVGSSFLVPQVVRPSCKLFYNKLCFFRQTRTTFIIFASPISITVEWYQR